MDNRFNIVDLFFKAAKKYPNHLAIVQEETSITFREYELQVLSTSVYFQNKGIEKGDRVLIFVPMGIDLYRIVLALFNIGATAVFLDEWVSKRRMEECCKVAQCKAFIGVPKARVFAFFTSELRKIPIKLGVKQGVFIKNQGHPVVTQPNDTALITFTTGSTGVPKAAKRTHGFLHEQFQALLEKIDPRPEDVDMPVLPIVLLINLGVGCSSVIAKFNAKKPNKAQIARIYRQMQKHRVNRLVSSPFFVNTLARYLNDNQLELPLLKKVFTGGAPVFPSEASTYINAFPTTQVEIIYGSTEAEPISSISAGELVLEKDNLLKKGLNVGVPYRKTEVKIILITEEDISVHDERELEEWVLPSGRIGEIIVSGAHVLREYFNNEKALKRNKIFIGEKCWHRTGDSGYMEKGQLYLTGRCNTLIPVEEGFLSPFTYENYFQTIEGVEIGTLMKIDGKVYAILEVRERQLRKKQSIERIKAQVLKAGVPCDEINIVSKIPRDPRHNSKIDYGRVEDSFN